MSTENEDNNQSTEDIAAIATESSMELSDETLEAVAGGVMVSGDLKNSQPINPDVNDHPMG
jgi:hypothetical protein